MSQLVLSLTFSVPLGMPVTNVGIWLKLLPSRSSPSSVTRGVSKQGYRCVALSCSIKRLQGVNRNRSRSDVLICFKNSATWLLRSASENSNCDTMLLVSVTSAILERDVEVGGRVGNVEGFAQVLI